MDPKPAPPQDTTLAAQLQQLFGAGEPQEVSFASLPAGKPTSEVVRKLLQASGPGSRYEIRSEIARGGMGAILEVWDRDLRRTLAMKVALDREGDLDDRRIARFLEEAQITGQLDHPGVVPVHELGVTEDGRVFFTMRRVQGRDLREVFHCVNYGLEGWNRTRALGVLLRVCEAVAFAHSRGVIHRDLKPANVMVGEFGEVYVMDWGLARVVEREKRTQAATHHSSVRTVLREERQRSPESPLVTVHGDVLGTPAYMAPEQARGDVQSLSPRSDVYAIGAMLYHLLAGEAPYLRAGVDTTPMQALEALRKGPPPPLYQLRTDVPPELVAICERAMAYEPEGRYADVSALGEDLRAFLEHRVVAAYETGAWAEARKWVQRNRPLAASLAAAVTALVVGLVIAWTQYGRAERSAELAREAAMQAEAQTAQVLRLSDADHLQELEEEADQLWPAHPARITDLESWLSRARDLLVNLQQHRATLEEMRRSAIPGGSPPAARPDIGPELAASADPWRFATPGEQWQHDMLTRLVAGLEQMEAGLLGEEAITAEHGWSVARRLGFARRLEAGFSEGGQYERAWAAALPELRAAYPGIDVQPQIGLVPLGPDPDSGLWEFAHLMTGVPPRRDGDGRLQIDGESGAVLVLLPGGSFWMGAQRTDPAGRHYDPQARTLEGPVHEVQLSPFLLSKYELTQGQWERLTGRNPSHVPGNPEVRSPIHPVEQVSWLACMEWLPRAGLTLPTEAQWEYGARGGTDTPWWTGADRESLRTLHAANLADKSAADYESPWDSIHDWPELDDGYPTHAPFGSFAANPFGLHEVTGNVWELCLDGWDKDFYARSPREDPLVDPALFPARVLRGGSFIFSATFARSAMRLEANPDFAGYFLGVRPARRLDR